MKKVTVVGSGIIGLTTAILLQEAGFQVRIITKENFDHTVSHKVGAIWFPFEILPKEKTNTWASLSYKRYEIDQQANNGVSFIPFITAYNSEINTEWTQHLPEGKVREALHSELPTGMERAFISMVPLAEPPKYLPYLCQQFLGNGGILQHQEIHSLAEMALLDEYVINCTGLGAKELCQDKLLHPMRGQILRCEKLPLTSFANTLNKGALGYVITRTEDCIIGGTDYENDWNEKIDPADTKLILKRLKQAGVSETPSILEEIVGLRPRRKEVRFEFDNLYTNVFHNYGHGGAGYTVAWGCAIQLAEMLGKK
ncbi:FAD-dependent oxidoreductase [Algoriphagus halophytocola]|uniref:D-amino-acid oxidase n=1 Tax=Algoriphagus halophytocola TaxID=2991499 RepID=A0ABY6MLL9_9BACT|nr:MULTISPECIES: FAD-dependent oxidoreductase [unclassified Algoriphagus]UZD24439.1 FAD-binding oxidoreductase [Algoriphagus sp. TR-M5]WBL41803.1 FAD-dependent oxidoreductase [Algoriphagus sp. TR-M9]